MKTALFLILVPLLAVYEASGQACVETITYTCPPGQICNEDTLQCEFVIQPNPCPGNLVHCGDGRCCRRLEECNNTFGAKKCLSIFSPPGGGR